jgi:tungstate transport system substrate-binding protein
MKINMFRHITKFFLISFIAYFPIESSAEPRFIMLASTTSTANSGLFDKILPIFKKKSGIEVRVVAVGTGQALRIAENGDADVLFVHHKPSELLFIKKGFGVKRFDVMYNDFIIVGPKSDPAKINNIKRVTDAFVLIASSRSNFVSRGDESGTHKREQVLWQAALIDPTKDNGAWYREIGAGMGVALNTASAMGAYTLSDRGTWLSYRNKASLEILFERDQNLLNPYGVILVNPKKFQHIRAKDGQLFINWLISDEGQNAIDDYRIEGQQLFFSNAK